MSVAWSLSFITAVSGKSAEAAVANAATFPSAGCVPAPFCRDLPVRPGKQQCRFPGCTRPPNRCDLDHTLAAEVGGPTTVDNLAHLCRGDHTLKHHGGWTVKQLEPGVLEWTSPNGYVHTDRPDPTVHFAA